MKVYPVVHVTTPEASATQADLAFELGADGVYLIHHGPREGGKLFDTFNRVKAKHPENFVGINPLDGRGVLGSLKRLRQAYEEGHISAMPDGLWIDRADAHNDTENLTALRNQDPLLGHIRILGGVAFKYTQEYTDHPTTAANLAAKMAPYLDVITTSGEGTGKPPSVEKIKAMSERTGRPVAIASGIDADNVANYAPFASEILAASSVETHPYSGIFDRTKLGDLISAAHSADKVES